VTVFAQRFNQLETRRHRLANKLGIKDPNGQLKS
jgi:hypothetical protein